MERSRSGLQPLQSVKIKRKNGELCKSSQERLNRWTEHFTDVLNVRSKFDFDRINGLPQLPSSEDLAKPPVLDELLKAISSLRAGKAGGISGILSDLLNKTGLNFHTALLKLLHDVWKERRVVKEWADGIIVPIPKKGNLQCCDNWRGISLLDVVGKAAAKISQLRIAGFMEDRLLESQCGFRCGRGCDDMIFC